MPESIWNFVFDDKGNLYCNMSAYLEKKNLQSQFLRRIGNGVVKEGLLGCNTKLYIKGVWARGLMEEYDMKAVLGLGDA